MKDLDRTRENLRQAITVARMLDALLSEALTALANAAADPPADVAPITEVIAKTREQQHRIQQYLSILAEYT